MLERLHFILRGCVVDDIQDSNHFVALNKSRESLKEEGALAVVIIIIIIILLFSLLLF